MSHPEVRRPRLARRSPSTSTVNGNDRPRVPSRSAQGPLRQGRQGVHGLRDASRQSSTRAVITEPDLHVLLSAVADALNACDRAGITVKLAHGAVLSHGRLCPSRVPGAGGTVRGQDDGAHRVPGDGRRKRRLRPSGLPFFLKSKELCGRNSHRRSQKRSRFSASRSRSRKTRPPSTPLTARPTS